MKWPEVLRTAVLPGALAGLVGGLVFGVTMSELDLLPTFAQLVRADSSIVGFIVVIANAGIIGAGFGILVWYQRPGAGETLFWGMVYGTLWWYLGQLTILPLIDGDGLAWDLHSAQAEFPRLLGYLLYGATTGLALVFLQWKRHLQAETMRISRGALLRGALAGLLSALLLGATLNAQDQLLAFSTMMTSDSYFIAWLVTLSVGLVAGVGFALLYPRSTEGSGAGLIRGTVYGLLWWVVGALSLVPVFSGVGLTWSVGEVREVFATLPGYLLFGAGLALLYKWLGAAVHVLFSDLVVASDEEGIGTQGLRIVGRSAMAGIVGGLLFSIVMLQTDFFPRVAELIGSTSSLAGFIVHLGIAVLIGTSYGLLFSRQSYDVGSALGWGVSYGFFWSILGPLTLMPMLLGTTPQWTVEAVVAAFPNLIGHLAYGAGLGVTLYILEARHSAWWIPRTQVQAVRVERHKEQLLTSAPALWTLLVFTGLMLPILAGM